MYDRGQRIADYPRNDKRFPDAVQYHDVLWAFLFVIYYALFVAFCITNFQSTGDYSWSAIDAASKLPSNANVSKLFNFNDTFWTVLALSVVLATLFGVIYLCLLKAFPRAMVWLSFICMIVFCGALAAYFFYIKQIGPAIIFLLFTVLLLCLAFCLTSQVAFTVMLLNIVMDLVWQYPGLIVLGLASIPFKALLLFPPIEVFVWAIHALKFKVLTQGNAFGMIIASFLCFFWALQVVVYIVHTTVAGVAASWYFRDAQPAQPNATSKALRRALTYNFGSICLGALLIAIIQTIHAMVKYLRRDNDNALLMCLVECCIRCIERIVEVFNRYVFTYVAIYGMSYCDSAQYTWNLLTSDGFNALISDSLVGFVVFLGLLFGAAFTVAGSAIYLASTDRNYLMLVLAYVVAVLVMAAMMSVIVSAVNSLFVCIVDAPERTLNGAFHHYDQDQRLHHYASELNEENRDRRALNR
eukprot:TRINITY_DN2459_c0_g1_i1.p1 TRINITY_DN2459_c0_g1~~TRINITY_DN2459_c0_g1_i1.p1  ORF type:complete len:490 (-),score=187.34 TRINITY_DN2459_c0_g1_i1:102-1508(-)